MKRERPSRGIRRTLASARSESTSAPGHAALAELEQRLDLRARLQAIIDELDVLDADVDVPRTLTEGLAEDLDRALAEERGKQ